MSSIDSTFLTPKSSLSAIVVGISRGCASRPPPFHQLSATHAQHVETDPRPKKAKQNPPTKEMDLPSSRSFVDNLITELSTFTSSGKEQPRTQGHQNPNPLASLPATKLDRVKPIILTLHCLFPNDLLPALDILDRSLVQRLVLVHEGQNQDTAATVPDQNHATVADGTTQTEDRRNDQTSTPLAHNSIFLVTSASAAPRQIAAATRVPGGVPGGSTRTVGSTPTPLPTATATQDPEKGYEVRLNAWNCTCLTFALSAFKGLDSRQRTSTSHPETQMETKTQQRDTNVPVPAPVPPAFPFGGTLTRDTDRGSPPACKHILACVLFARCPGLFGHGDGGLVSISIEEMAGWCAGWGG